MTYPSSMASSLKGSQVDRHCHPEADVRVAGDNANDATSTDHQDREGSLHSEFDDYADEFDDTIPMTTPVKRAMKLRADYNAKIERQRENARALGGMRNPANAVHRIPRMRSTGKDIAKIIEDYLNAHPEFEHNLMKSVGTENIERQGTFSEQILGCRRLVAQYLEADLSTDTCITEVSQRIMETWARKSGDPDIPVTQWLREGAPAGISRHPANVGVFPQDAQAPSHEFEFTHHSEHFVNYMSMDESPYGEEVLRKLVASDYVKKFDNMASARAYLDGAEPVLTKMVLITTMKEDGTLKHRLIMDCRVSGVNSHTAKHERIVLPRIGDLIRDCLHLLRGRRSGQRLTFLVCDYTDAFFKMPLHKGEQPYFVATHKGKVYVYTRIVQGSLT